MSNKLISLERPWKATLQTHPKKSLLSLHSLWDVIYSPTGQPLIELSKGPSIGGFTLEHNIICYSQQEYSSYPNIYKGDASVLYGGNSYSAEELYELLCIDASIARYDSRSKSKFIENDNTATTTKYCNNDGSSLSYLLKRSPVDTPIFNKGKFILHDKESVLMPYNQKDFVDHGVYITENGLRDDSYITNDIYSAPFTSPLPDDKGTNSRKDWKDPIYLIKEDNGFKGTLSTSVKMAAYNRIVFNPYNKWTAALVAKALYPNFKNEDNRGIFNQDIVWNDQTGSIKTSLGDDDFCDFIFKILPGLINGKEQLPTYDVVDIKSDWATLLKNTYIWIKAPFFGDYVKPDVFNQDLNEESDVIHKNLILSKSADYNRYDETTNIENKNTINVATLPYIPSVSPTLDLISNKMLRTASLNVDKKVVEGLIEKSDNPNKEIANIGNIAIAPETREGVTIRLPNYYDPELKEDSDAYLRSDTNSAEYHIPTIIPKAGNLYLDGRIISPTTDEIWTYLKQLTEGRISDSKVENESAIRDISLPVGTNKSEKRENYNDTRLASVPESEFQFMSNNQGEVYGDVLKAEGKIDESGKNYLISVTKHINNNDGIKYIIYNSIKNLSSEVTKFDQTTNPESAVKTRDVVNFTAWSKKDNFDESVKDGEVIVDTQTLWAPRHIPLSLRELEAALLGVKYNTISLARFTKENFTVSGPLGYEDKDEKGTTLAAGSLYQMHRNYNYKVDNPNTFFRLDGEGNDLYDTKGRLDPKAGMDATFSDLANNHSEDGLMLYNSQNPKTSKMPLLVENYGKSIYLKEESGEYMGTDIYMAADGTWRYKNEHTRIPILRSEY